MLDNLEDNKIDTCKYGRKVSSIWELKVPITVNGFISVRPNFRGIGNWKYLLFELTTMNTWDQKSVTCHDYIEFFILGILFKGSIILLKVISNNFSVTVHDVEKAEHAVEEHKETYTCKDI